MRINNLVVYMASLALMSCPRPAFAQVDTDPHATVNNVPRASKETTKCPSIAPGPVSITFLAESFLNPGIQDLASIEAIRTTLNLYALALDGRSFDALNYIFTPDVRANYSDPFPVLNGVDEIIEAISPGLTFFASTQHAYGSQYIYICNETAAISVTYLTATHFFTPYQGIDKPVNNSQVLIDRAQYQDVWVRSRKEGRWLISNRNEVRMGPPTLDGAFPTPPE